MPNSAIRRLVASALQLELRKEISGKFVAGEWRADLAGYDESQAAEKRKTRDLDEAWRD
ncbi:MAG: hypothetical protein WEB53_09465 [Akkermansiaceae bacterium]